jgi:hypothetical protein
MRTKSSNKLKPMERKVKRSDKEGLVGGSDMWLKRRKKEWNCKGSIWFVL